MADFTVALLFDGIEVDSTAGNEGPSFSQATVIFGDTSGSAGRPASRYFYDLVTVTRGAEQLLANPSFEGAVNALQTGGNVPPTGAAWSPVRGSAYDGPSIVTSPVSDGSKAARVNVPAGSNAGSFFVQDFALGPEELFDFSLDVWPEIGEQDAELVFDWDRGSSGAAAGIALVEFGPAATTYNVFGATGSADPLPFEEWTRVTLRIFIGGGWKIGAV